MSVLSKTDLEERLVNWAREYGGGRYENIGYSSRNILQTLIEHGGFVPDSGGFKRPPVRTASDEVEMAVRDMESNEMFKHGRVLRAEYFMPNKPIEQKVENLRFIGLPMSRSGYYLYLGMAKAYLLGALCTRSAADSCV